MKRLTLQGLFGIIKKLLAERGESLDNHNWTLEETEILDAADVYNIPNALYQIGELFFMAPNATEARRMYWELTEHQGQTIQIDSKPRVV